MKKYRDIIKETIGFAKLEDLKIEIKPGSIKLSGIKNSRTNRLVFDFVEDLFYDIFENREDRKEYLIINAEENIKVEFQSIT